MNPERKTSSAVTMTLGIAAFVALTATVIVGLTMPRSEEQQEYSRLIGIHPGIAWASVRVVVRARSREQEHRHGSEKRARHRARV